MTHRELCTQVRALYRPCPRSIRWHVRGRLKLCPFDAVADALPREGVVLDYGCGHGHFGWYLACARPGLHVLGSDIDARKIAVAQSIVAPEGCAAPEFRCGGTEAFAEAGPLDGVAVLDVLYLLPEAKQEALLAWAVGRLAAGGVLVLKLLDTEAGWRTRRALMQEWIMVNVLRRTSRSAERFAAAAPAQYVASLERLGLEARAVPLATWNPSVLIVGRKP